MCRLALMNAAAAGLLDTRLEAFFLELERSQGGHGNGIAALWSETGSVKMRKGLSLTPEAAATYARTALNRGASWILFHTRFATTMRSTSRNCHPFRCGKLTLAHNGHSHMWAVLGQSLGITDSECIARVWEQLGLPLFDLQEEDGIFMGFSYGAPFVIKGTRYRDLSISVQAKNGAVLFASEIPKPLRKRFDETIEAGHVGWYGWNSKPFNLASIERRYSPRTFKARDELSSAVQGAPVLPHDEKGEEADRTSLEILRAMYQRLEHEQGQHITHVSDSDSE